MKRKLTKRNKRKLTLRKQLAKSLGIPSNLLMTAHLSLAAEWYLELLIALYKPKQYRGYICFDETFAQPQFITAIYQDLLRWSYQTPNSNSYKAKIRIESSLLRLFPEVDGSPELSNVDFSITLGEDLRHVGKDYDLNRTTPSPYQKHLEEERKKTRTKMPDSTSFCEFMLKFGTNRHDESETS